MRDGLGVQGFVNRYVELNGGLVQVTIAATTTTNTTMSTIVDISTTVIIQTTF